MNVSNSNASQRKKINQVNQINHVNQINQINQINLRFPTEADEVTVNALDAVFAKENFDFSLRHRVAGAAGGVEPWGEYLQRLRDEARGTNLPEGRVPAEFLLAEVDGEIVGRVSIRFALNDYLYRFGGHIGYGVAPRFRRQGHATEILRQAIGRVRARWQQGDIPGATGDGKILVTCDDENVGSFKTIEACGGVLENRVDNDGALVRRYWI
ncbi:acetyltransferase [Corynebacterium falsenii DSM 44353]|uniref:GNAT family N-acetyltransferase n=1 Tax=Corynebacterium falsenii TaxID=108486 RepID=A0A418Q7D5_9CORY|nr:GNAT family N-acetyltransferase [Corynebacterium falsenii]AHI03370.1 acetyltransferase [Corynebacterium falsenii DSM 44353]RIX34891.1 GNAT family N-acetyltransferase [Corynebacterium falsenii]UBI04060.1 GNAT family N-acetyltransferase [Corynebacterium falsenii]UBI05926.1 GNAT family N-acetyltransferase [Corynebacterium falsenii]